MSGTNVELFGADDPHMAEALAIRLAVFVGEQQVPEEIEIDEYDRPGSSSVHAIVYVRGVAAAAGRFFERDARTVQIGRMAVLTTMRGHGLGRILLDALIGEARRRGYADVELHAQTHARGFYEKAGFAPFGDEFDDAGIPHIAMKRTIRSNN